MPGFANTPEMPAQVRNMSYGRRISVNRSRSGKMAEHNHD